MQALAPQRIGELITGPWAVAVDGQVSDRKVALAAAEGGLDPAGMRTLVHPLPPRPRSR